MKNFKSSFIFFLILIAVSSYAYFFEYKHKENKEKLKALNEQLLAFSETDIDNITINNEDRIVLKKINNLWQIIEPINKLAKQSLLSELISSLTSSSTLIKENPDYDDLIKYNINENLYILTNIKGETYMLKFGAKAPVSEETYILLEEDNAKKIVLHNVNLNTNITKSLNDYRDTKIFLDSYNVNKVDFNNFVLLRGDDLWIVKDKPYKVDESKVSSFINDVFNMQAKDYLFSKNLSESEINKKWQEYFNKPSFTFGLKNKELVFYTSSIKNNSYFSYELKEYENEKLLKTIKNEIYIIDNSLMDIFNKDFNYFLDKFILSFKEEEIHKIEVFKKDIKQVLLKIEEAWLKDTNSFDFEKVNDFINYFKNLTVTNFVKDFKNFKKFSLDKPSYTVVFKDDKDNVIYRIDLGNLNKKDSNVYINFKDLIYQVEIELVDKIESILNE